MAWRSADWLPSAHIEQKVLLPQAGSLFSKSSAFFLPFGWTCRGKGVDGAVKPGHDVFRKDW